MKIFVEIPYREEEHLYRVQSLLYKCYKFQIMWALRSIESEIEREGGSIFIDQPNDDSVRPYIRLKGFSSDLEDQMRDLISNMKYEIV